MTTKRERLKLFNNSGEQDTVQAAPMVQWVGGKRRLAPHILPVFPDHSCYVEHLHLDRRLQKEERAEHRI